MTTRKIQAEVVNPDDDKNVIHITTGELFRPPIWSFRKAVAKLAELYPETSTNDLWMIIRDRSYAEDTQYEWMGYRDEVAPYIWYIYTELKDVRKNPMVTLCMWILRCSHYYWFGGPRPEHKYRPRKKNKKAITEAWRDSLVCPTCKCGFTYDGLLTDTREEVMLHYNQWLSGHTKVCPNITWNRIELANRKKEIRRNQKEREALNKQRDANYQEWLAKMNLVVDANKQERDAHLKTLEVMERALNLIVDLSSKEKTVEVVIRLGALAKYMQKNHPSDPLRKRMIYLCNKYSINFKG